MGKMGSAGVSLSDGKGGHLSLEYESGSTEILPRWSEDGSLESIHVEAKLTANLAEPNTDTLHITDKDFLSQMEQALSQDMEEKITALLSLSSSLDADFLGLKAHLRQSDAEKTAALNDDWLKKAIFTLECETKISYTRELGDRMSAEGGEK